MPQPSIDELTRPSLTWAQVLELIPHMPPGVAQSWINRGHVDLEQVNPGRGRARLFAPADVAKLALLERFSAFGVPVDRAKEYVDATADRVSREGFLDWNDGFAIDYRGQRSPRLPVSAITYAGPPDDFAVLSKRIGDDALVCQFTQWFRGFFRRHDPDGEDDPAQRESLARRGIHAEPVLIIPVGEIVNGTLLAAHQCAYGESCEGNAVPAGAAQ